MRGPLPPVQYPNIKCLGNDFLEVSRAPGILGFLGNIGYQGQDAIFGAVYAHFKGRTKKLQRHGLHGFALDQPSINRIGPCRKMETVGNSWKHDQPKLVQPARCDLRLFPTVSPWTPLDLPKKKLRCAETLIFKILRVGQVFGWSCFQLFPTVSIFLNGPILFMEGWSSANPCKPWRWSFFVRPLKCA